MQLTQRSFSTYRGTSTSSVNCRTKAEQVGIALALLVAGALSKSSIFAVCLRENSLSFDSCSCALDRQVQARMKYHLSSKNANYSCNQEISQK